MKFLALIAAAVSVADAASVAATCDLSKITVQLYSASCAAVDTASGNNGDLLGYATAKNAVAAETITKVGTSNTCYKVTADGTASNDRYVGGTCTSSGFTFYTYL